MSGLIGVTAATGKLGRLVIEQLKARVDVSRIVALVRSPEKAGDLGVAVREADYARPETLGPALDGVETLLLISGSDIGKRVEQHGNVIRAAEAAGLARIAYTSVLRCDSSELPVTAEHKGTEELLAAASIPYILLRNGWYTENYTDFGAVPGALATGRLIGSTGEGKISSAARLDYAEAAAVVLSTEGHEGKVYELAGDEGWTMAELAAEVSRASGTSVRYDDLSADEHFKTLAASGMPEGFAHFFVATDQAIARGQLFDDSGTLSKLIGRPTTPMRETIASFVSAAQPEYAA
jgi:NAD(P)H dehydrogenase (quinone)